MLEVPEISNLDFRNQEPPNSQSQNILDSQVDQAVVQADKPDNQDEVSKLNTILEAQTIKSMLNSQHIGVDS